MFRSEGPAPLPPGEHRMTEDIDVLIERVIQAAQDFKHRPIPLSSKRRVRKALRALCDVSPRFDLERVEGIEPSS